MDRLNGISDVISLLEDDACKVSIETNVYPSIYIAIAIYEYNTYGEYFIVQNKNPYNTFLKETTYFSYSDAMRKFSLVMKLYSDKLLSEENVLNKIYGDKVIIYDILNISSEYDLNKINERFLSTLFGNKNIIDIPKDPIIDLYFVKRFSNTTTLLRTMDLNEAKRVCNKNPGTIVVNSKNDIIYGEKDTHRKTPRTIENISYTKDIFIGTKVNVLKANLYKSATSNVPIRSISGTYKISSNIKNNRYQISSIFDDGLIVGYIRVNEIQKIK